MEFWELEDYEVAYSWFRAFRMWPGNGVVGFRRPRNMQLLVKKRAPHSPGSRPDLLGRHDAFF
eukprot:4887861-Pyramimonas_sp.AAC.1